MAQGPADPAPISTPQDASKWRDLRVRTLSALIAGPSFLAVLWFGGFAWQALVAALIVGMANEWNRLARAMRVPFWTGCALGTLYLGPAAVALPWLRADDAVGLANMLFVLMVVWASDIGAYLAGRLIGGPKLAPVISPGKTRSGAVGGLASAVLVGLIAAWSSNAGDPMRAALVACVLGVASQTGDLFESWVKRRAGVKDSGRLLPGHGGLLDRLDGLLAAAPLAALMALAAGEGVALWVKVPL